MNDITQRLADALARMTGMAEFDALDSRSNEWRSSIIDANQSLAAYDATQNDGCKPYKDSAFYVVATWNGERQIWREGFFDTEDVAARAFDRYVEDFITCFPDAPAFNPEIRELEV